MGFAPILAGVCPICVCISFAENDRDFAGIRGTGEYNRGTRRGKPWHPTLSLTLSLMQTYSQDATRRAAQSRTAWTDAETLSLCALYGHMLDLQTVGHLGRGKTENGTPRVSKAVLVRAWIAEHAPDRSKGSVEAKLMNLSAARIEMGLPIVDGYKPLQNMGADVRRAALAAWAS